MKEFLKGLRLWLAIGVLPTAASFAQSGWYQQAPYPTGNWLFAVATPDSSTIVAVGERGIIVRSTDGGETWTRQDSGTSNHLNGVSFVNASIGTATGGLGTILRTVDGGETWTTQPSGTSLNLGGVSFVDERTGTVVGARGTILRTIDGGE